MSVASCLKHPLLLRLRSVLAVLLALLLLGVVTRSLEAPAWQVVKAGQPEMNLQAIEGALGQGLVVGVLGGFRAIMADFLWIRTNTIWNRRDRVKLNAMVRLVTTIDPRSEFFWVNAARMVAYDVPHWRIDEEGGYALVPDRRQQVIVREQVEQACAMLERAREFHPQHAKLYLETAQIYLIRLKDYAQAAKWFLLASQQPDAPYYAARIHGELLRRQGKDAEAYAFLKQLYAELNDDPHAQKGVILDRIHELEVSLKVPIWTRFQSQVTGVGDSAGATLEQKVRMLEQGYGSE
ncbi:MAG TPA: hypothetical protein DD423_01075 [Opitutae bacterium]|nr:hypothetical protein [Opitutae bacterium]